jgi:acrylyl-CoA reductase (NADPH)
MAETGRAIVVRKQDKELSTALEAIQVEQLPEGDLLIQVQWSSLNYKDAMALGNRGILRGFPAVPGIDLAGAVLASDSPGFRPGQQVLVTGWGIGETRWGGFSQLARVRSEWALPLPAGLDGRAAMAFGTAGLTAMLCVMALEARGLDLNAGEILVTGASGGVGSLALALLAARGCKVVAMSGKPELEGLLTRLGASRIVPRDAYATPARPGRFMLEGEAFQAAVDTVGGDTLASIIARLQYGGSVAACGLVGGANLDSTVYPFILRGVNLLGVDSVRCPTALRAEAWRRLATEFPLGLLERLVREVGLEEVPAEAERMLDGRARGRVVVRVG